MNRVSCLHRCRLFAAALALCLIPFTAAAQCSTGVSVPEAGASGRFIGWAIINADTLLQRGGNSFLMDCAAHVTTVSVLLTLPDHTNRDIDPLAPGDLVRCEILDENRNVIMADVQPVPAGGPVSTVTFDFSDAQFRITPGLYQFMLTPVGPRWGFLMFGEVYADGAYQEEYMGYWTQLAGYDAVFDVAWDPTSDLVPAAARSFGAIKALYR